MERSKYQIYTMVLKILEDKYPRLIAALRRQWTDGHGGPEKTELEYILNHLADALAAQHKTFLEADRQRLMCTTAALFRQANNPALRKTRYPTGFYRLDEALGGGLTAGVHYIGAISSLGKSTFALQVADQIAKNKTQVIYISLEMSMVDLTAKLVSMYTFINSRTSGGAVRNNLAKTSSILTSEATKDFSEEEWKTVFRAAEEVVKNGKYITVLENQQGALTVDDIADYVALYQDAYNKTPVLIIDYLQILAAPAHQRSYSDKQLVDYNVSKFRSLASKYKMPVLVISAFNRDNYNTKASFQSYKDSGNIEYSSDTLLGLQLHGVGEKDFDIDQAKKAFPRRVDLVILKQRYGPAGITIPFYFYTKFNYFKEMDISELPADLPTPFVSSSKANVRHASRYKNIW